MKRIILAVTFLVAMSVNLQAQAPSKEEMKKAWEAYAMPGDMHKMLAKTEGVWIGDITMWMDPAAPPTKSKGKGTAKMILGGRYLHTKHEGMMEGKPFEGYGVTGYDNAKKMFQDTWIDNMGTGIMTLEGTWDGPRKMIHYTGKMVDPMGGPDIMVRQEITFIDDNTHKMEMFMTMPGKAEMKSMEIIMKRDMSAMKKK